MSFPPTLPNNPMFPTGYPQPNVPPIPGFQIPLGGLPLGALPMGVTVPPGVASISAPPVRNQASGVIAAPPVISMPNPAMLYPPAPAPVPPSVPPNNPPPLIQKTPPEPVKKPLSITTVFVGNITDRASDMLIRQLLNKCGSVHNWKRIQGPDGKLQAFGFCDYADPESAMRAIRLLHEYSICEKKLIVRVDAKTQEKLDEYNRNEQRGDQNELDEEDKIVKGQLSAVMREHELELMREPESKSSKRYSNKDKDKDKNEDFSDLEMEDDKRLLIHREIDKFRDTYKKYDEEKEEEKRKKEEERFRKNEKGRNDIRRSRSKERDRDDRGRSRKSRDRDRRRRSPSFDEKLDRTRSESPVDEEELLLRRRRQEQIREKELSYQRRLRDWESREKRKAKEYEREQLKEQRRKKEEEIEKQKLKQFLQDYDDYKHDEKYYSGKAFIQRQAERRKEIEQDEYEREQERKELEELKKKLSQEGHPDPDSEVRKRLNIETPNEGNKIKNLLDEARSNSIFNMDEDSQGSASNLGGLVKTFGFAGMKISTGQNLENPAHISNGSAETSNTKKSVPEESANVSKQPSRSDSKRKRLTVSEVFSTNDDDDPNSQKKKKRPPPNALLEDSNTDSNLSMADNRTGSNSQLSQEEKRIQIKNLIDQIPTSETEVFNYALDWDLLDNNLMERRVRPWIGKKIRDYIGEEEEALLDFICAKLYSKSSAQSLLDEVSMVLDDEALVFVVKLWRLLIFETEARKLGLTRY